MRNKKSRFNKKLLLTAGVIILALILIGWRLHGTQNKAIVSAPSRPISQLPKQQVANQSKDVASNPTSSVDQGGAVDQNGQKPNNVSSDSSNWATSTSKLITLKNPIRNSTFKSGDTIYGSASVSPVQFRLVDNSVGVITQGTLSVVNGSFSGVANFKSYSTSGRLDIFNTDTYGREINEVQVPLNF